MSNKSLSRFIFIFLLINLYCPIECLKTRKFSNSLDSKSQKIKSNKNKIISAIKNDNKLAENDTNVNLNSFNATTNYQVSFLQTNNTSNEETIETDVDKNNLNSKVVNSRLARFLWAIALVLIICFGLFFFVKFSVDWATASKNELNRLREQKGRDIANFLNIKHFLKEQDPDSLPFANNEA